MSKVIRMTPLLFMPVLFTNLNTFASTLHPEIELRKEMSYHRLRNLNLCTINNIKNSYHFDEFREEKKMEHVLKDRPVYPPIPTNHNKNFRMPPPPQMAHRCAACPFKTKRGGGRKHSTLGSLKLESDTLFNKDFACLKKGLNEQHELIWGGDCSCGDLWMLQKRVRTLERMLLDLINSFLECDDISFLERESLKLQIYQTNLKNRKRPTVIRDELKRILKFRYE